MGNNIAVKILTSKTQKSFNFAQFAILRSKVVVKISFFDERILASTRSKLTEILSKNQNLVNIAHLESA